MLEKIFTGVMLIENFKGETVLLDFDGKRDKSRKQSIYSHNI